MKSFRRAGTDILLGLLVLGYIVISFYLVEYLQRSYSRDVAAERTHYLSQQLALVRSRLEAMVTSEIFLANGLASYVSVAPLSTPKQWLPMAEQIAVNAPHIRNIAVAPDNVVKFVFPVEGNQKALGLDYSQYPKQLRTVNLARRTQKIFVAGPLALVQGGMGVIARMPIFTDPPHNTEYKGVLSVVLDWDALLRDSGALDFPPGIELAMRGVDGTGELGAVFLGKAADFQSALLTENVHLISGSWQLAIKAEPEAFATVLGSKYNLIRICGYSVALLIFISMSVMAKAYKNAQRYSYEDVLTKVGNRRRVVSVLERLIRRHSKFAVVNIDLNEFKMVNDSFGHPVGDALLIEVAQRLEGALRSYDTIARVGGDEFLIVLPRVTRRNDLHVIGEKIREQVCEAPFEFKDISLVVSISIGFSVYPDDGEDLEELLHRADKAMYDDKHRHYRRSMAVNS